MAPVLGVEEEAVGFYFTFFLQFLFYWLFSCMSRYDSLSPVDMYTLESKT